MPYPANTARVVLHATVGGTEEMQTGFWIHTATAADAQDLATELAPLVTTFLQATQNGTYQTVTWDRLDVYTYTGGSTKAAGQGTATLAVTGTTSGNGPALDTCGVLTLLTGLPGRSRRGRMYLPYHLPIANGTTMADATMNARANALVDLIDAVNTAQGGIAVSVVSGTLGQYFPVTGVQYDLIPDVQRRRVNQLTGARTTVPV
jgi:hypothetical protein